MILDKIENINKYKKLHPGFKKAFEFILSSDLDSLSIGKHEIDGDDIFVSVNEYLTKNKDESYLEAHQKYIDIQIITRGTELIGISQHDHLKSKNRYNVLKDIAFYHGDCDYLNLNPGTFVIFFPGDLHKPGISGIESSSVKKIVVKVKL